MQRVSLSFTQPLVGAVLAAFLAAVFLGSTLTAPSMRMERISQQQTDAYAALVSESLAAGTSASLASTLDRVTDGRYVLVDVDGRLVSGNPALIGRRSAKRAAISVSGAPAGYLVTDKLQPLEFILPPQILLIFVGFAIAAAYFTGQLYTNFVLNGLASIEGAFSRTESRDSDAPEPPFTFTEFTKLRMRLERRIREIQRGSVRLQAAAYQNPDSGLPNLRAFYEAVNGQLVQADYDTPLSVLCLDVDHFQKVSEWLGLERSHELVQLTTERIERELSALHDLGRLDRRGCLLAHLQGDQFALLLPAGTGRDAAGQVARNLRRAFAAPFVIDQRRVTLGLSGGIVVAPDDGDQVGNLLRRAQAALRSLRDENRDGFAFYQSRLDRVTEDRLLLEADVRRAMDENTFWPAFQPKIDLRTGEISGCEALARWTRADGKQVSPAEFIPVAEQTGLIIGIGDTILRQACNAAAGWVRAGWPVPVAVNVSAAQLDDPTFCDRVLDAITESGLPPGMLELEITESMAVRDASHVEAVLKPLRRMGVRLAIDDFGTGHANLSIITRLNFDVFKIDRSFVSQLTTDPSAPAIVDMILAMAHTLNHATVAEGVETAEQMAFLRDRGCTFAQGFFYSGPLPEARFREFLQSWSPNAALVGERKRA
ncbi:MAG: bifunctional diguanylate cyclase/phosphodiesterase [Pseudomonadota bacterium]